MVLKELIDYLEECDQNVICTVGFSKPHSYRGVYSEVAFEPTEYISVSDMLESAKSAVGRTFIGWKGGEFKMHEYTDCHLAYLGETGEGIGRVLLDYMTGKVSTFN